jgi:hypothetical protein
MSWVLGNAREAFACYRDLWDETNHRLGNHILLDSTFVELLVRHFASANTLIAALTDGQNSGIALVEPVRQGLWQTFQPSQAPLGLILLSPNLNKAGQIHWLIRKLPGYAMGLAILQQDPDLSVFHGSMDGEFERLDYITTSRLTVTGTFEEYWKTRSHNLVHNLSRQRRRFTEQKVLFELLVERNPACVAKEIGEYGRLEGSSWKAKNGTAITPDNQQGIFYREMLEHFCGRGEGAIYRLNMNGACIASALCLERNDTLIILKITYDESLPKCSPGLLLHEDMLKILFTEKRVNIVEYYGRYTDWHRKWTNETRTMYHLNAYRYRWVASARRVLKLVGGGSTAPVADDEFQARSTRI